ncbi:sugar ABC transporter substrate-binding protein [Leifsonia shinshuensis]|uniref:Ribose transport system substrate-binding protein n=1 Tax=Leifsonia shinshuensis TaxID=150026 RepID=A0A853D3M5_9MICO|nr:sugar ABC transporter substrate-binding protein [Leifsonia shinshuensis]NYJ25610.1 ribose transport system substrate-binding protein [Leifsonia shinshuensis]
MHRYARRTAGVLAAASLTVGLAACSSVASVPADTSGSTKGITIAGVFGNTFDPFWTSIGCGASQEAKKLGVTYKEFSSTSADTAAFDQSFNSAKLTNPNGMFVNPLNPDQFVSQYQTLMSQGVPIVTLNATTPPSQYKIVGTDVTHLDFVDDTVALVPKDASGKLAIINGVPGLVPVENRLNPVVQAILKGRSGLTALDPVYTQFDSSKATQAVSSLIVANPDLQVIVAADGPDGAATAAAVKAAGKAGKITVIALDATPPEVAALKDGTITGLVAQAPKKIGAEQLSTLVDFLKTQKTPSAIKPTSDTTGIPQKLLTSKNVDDSANSDWVYTASCK